MASTSAMLLGLLLCLSLHAASASRALLQSSPNTTLTGLVGGTSALSTLLSAVSTAGLADALGGNGTFTVFAPSNDAFTKDIKSIYCIKDYGFGGKCANASDLLAAQNLRTILLNHVVAGSFPASSLANGTLLKTLGGAVQRVVILPNGTVTVGGAPVVTADVAATNGLAHVMGGVLYRDSQFNTTTIGTYLDTIADLGQQVTSPQSFPEAKKALMVQDALDNVDRFRSYRPIVERPDGGYTYPMPLLFDNTQGNRESFCVPTEQPKWTYPEMTNVTRPADNETLAYMSVMELAALIKSKQVTSTELVDLYTARLKQYDNVLEAVVTYTTDLAYQQAALADQLLANGTYLGPLHGIPYGLKDLIAVPPYRTTWGSGAFINQVVPREATVYSKLKAAGAVLVAKLSTGEMATGDEWWGGKTKCPWNIAVGASGSSAGPGAGVAAGLVGFALGTETGGSIIGPAAQNGISGFRPTFGVTSRAYCMALSQTLDKVGPMARTAADAAVILDVIRGKDGIDTSACNVALPSPFTIDVTNLTVGYLPDTPAAALTIFNETLKMKLVPVSFKNSAPDFSALYEVIRGAEAAAYFDYWMRSGNIENNTAPLQWPVRLRRSRMIPAVEYIQATRVRGVAITEMFAAFSGVDVFLGPSTTYTSYGNIVNIPEISVPYGFAPATVPSNYTASTPRKTPLNVGIYGLPYTDSKILAVAMAFQNVNTANKLRPPIDLIEPEVLSNCSYPLSRCNIPAATVALLSQTGINNPPVQIKTYGSV